MTGHEFANAQCDDVGSSGDGAGQSQAAQRRRCQALESVAVFLTRVQTDALDARRRRRIAQSYPTDACRDGCGDDSPGRTFLSRIRERQSSREPMPVTTDLRDATLTDLLPFSDIRCNQTKWIAISIVGRRMFADIGEKAKKPLFASLIHTAEVTGSSPVSPTSESVISVLPLVNSVHRCPETATTRRHSYSRPSASRTDV